MSLDILEILDELKYVQITDNPAEKFMGQIVKFLEKKFGKSITQSFMDEICRINEMTFEEILYRPDLFFNTFESIFGKKGKETIIKTLNKEFSKQEDFISADCSRDKLLSEIIKNDVIDFVQNMKSHGHVIFLWTDKNFRDKIMLNFLQTPTNEQILKILISSEPKNIDDVDVLLSKTLLPKIKTNFVKFWLNQLNEIDSSINSIHSGRIMDIDCNFWLDNGFLNDHLILEKELGVKLQQNLSIICGYNISKIHDQNYLKQLIQCAEFIILDKPVAVYKGGLI